MRSEMQIGALNDSIEIVRRRLEINEEGFEIETYDTVYRLRAKVSTIASRSKLSETVGNDREISKSTLKVMIRKRDIEESDYVKYKGKIYPIDTIHDYSDDFYELTIIKRTVGSGL